VHRRLLQVLIEEIFEAFSQHQLSEAQACEMLGIKRARLFRLERHSLQARLRGPLVLYAAEHKGQHAFPSEVQQFLHEQLRCIRVAAQPYRRRCNFALLAEEAHTRFWLSLSAQQHPSLCPASWH
jgi:predicted XRE-type DNA-binding protein